MGKVCPNSPYAILMDGDQTLTTALKVTKAIKKASEVSTMSEATHLTAWW
jgi:hypothetical protein